MHCSSTAALLQKLAKENDDAAIIWRKTEEIENTHSCPTSNRCFMQFGIPLIVHGNE